MPVCQSYCELLNDIVTQNGSTGQPSQFGGYACPFMVRTHRTGMASYAELAMYVFVYSSM